jgi:signal transduction histidine kinase
MTDHAGYARLVAACPLGIALLDRELRCVHANAALVTIGGDLVGRAWSDVWPDAEPMLRDVIASGVPVLHELASDSARSFEASYFAIHDEDGAFAGLGVIVAEITARARVERELRAGMDLREEVLAVVAHDLRSPLQAIAASAHLLRKHLADEPGVQASLDAIRRSTTRMGRLVEDLVSDASLRGGGLSLELGRVSIDELTGEALLLQAPVAGQRGVRLDRDIAGAEVDVECDRHRILQVLGNLIDNATRHSRAGGRVLVRAERTADRVRLTVRDEGEGMTPVSAARLQTGTSRARSLGLYICQGIVARHGGALSIESVLGAGTAVTFTLRTSDG